MLADDYWHRSMQKKATGLPFEDLALAYILATDMAYRTGGKYWWGRKLEPDEEP